MKRANILIIALLALILGSIHLSPVFAQEIDILVTPEEAQLDVGEHLQFEVFAFSTNGIPVKIDSLLWKVIPDSMGTVTQDGFFIAGRNVGDAEITITAFIGNFSIRKVISVKIGKLPKPFSRLKIVPEIAVVPTGGEQRFRVIVLNPAGMEVKPKHVRWEVRPKELGNINEEGVFKAGHELGQGKVMALVEIDGLTLRASARVIVSSLPSGAITGTITNDADNLPIEGARVKAIRLGRIHWIKYDTTDAQGSYLIGDLIPGVYVLYADAKGFVGEFYDDTRNFFEATPLIVSENDTLRDKDFGLSEGGKITGTVIADEDSLPLANAHVMAFLRVNPRFAHHAITSDDGTYEIDALPPGTYAVWANAKGYKGEYYDNAERLSDATLLTIDSTETEENINFALATASAIRGVVTHAVDGSPIAGATIRIFSPLRSVVDFRHFVLKETRTNENGEYIAQVPPGLYFVHASAFGFNGEFYDDVRDIFSATLVQVFPDSHTTGIDFDLVPRGSISGAVIDESSKEPIVGAVVQAFPENPFISAIEVPNIEGLRAKTDSSGKYTIENVPAAKYIVQAVAEGYLPEFFQEAESLRDATPVEVKDSTDVDMIDFTLLRGGSISGFVASEVDSVPIARALVEVWEVNSHFHRRAYTKDDGTYLVAGLRTGSYYVHVIAKGFFAEFYDNAHTRKEATPVEVVAPNETPDINVYLTPFKETKGTIAGQVFTDQDGSPILGAVVIAVSRNTLFPQIAFTDPEGFYQITNLNPGKYFVFAWARGFIGEFYDDARVFQEADPVFVQAGQVTGHIDFGLTERVRQGVYAIQGKITSKETGEPLEGVLVRALLTNNIEVDALTEADGSYVISDIPAGNYKIEATGVGYATGYFGGDNLDNASNVFVGNGNDADHVNFSLEEDNVTSVDAQSGLSGIPDRFDLFQNYPNPFNPETTIKYQLSQNSQVTLKIFNILGQEIRTLLDKKQEAGIYSVTWDGKDNYGRQVASGIYIFQLKAEDKFKMSRRMLLLK